MPLVFGEALKRRNMVASNRLIEQMEILGFAKCVARKTCMMNNAQYVTVLTDSLAKQFKDFNAVHDKEDQLEALADIRNVAGLLFLALCSSIPVYSSTE